MPFKVSRDGEVWSAYECGAEWGGYKTQEEVEAEVRRLQHVDHEAAKSSLAIAKRKLEQAKEVLAKPVRVRVMRTDIQPVLGNKWDD